MYLVYTVLLEFLRHGHRVVVVGLLRVVVSLGEPYALALQDVYCWYEFCHDWGWLELQEVL